VTAALAVTGSGGAAGNVVFTVRAHAKTNCQLFSHGSATLVGAGTIRWAKGKQSTLLVTLKMPRQSPLTAQLTGSVTAGQFKGLPISATLALQADETMCVKQPHSRATLRFATGMAFVIGKAPPTTTTTGPGSSFGTASAKSETKGRDRLVLLSLVDVGSGCTDLGDNAGEVGDGVPLDDLFAVEAQDRESRLANAPSGRRDARRSRSPVAWGRNPQATIQHPANGPFRLLLRPGHLQMPVDSGTRCCWLSERRAECSSVPQRRAASERRARSDVASYQPDGSRRSVVFGSYAGGVDDLGGDAPVLGEAEGHDDFAGLIDVTKGTTPDEADQFRAKNRSGTRVHVSG
jgi:hypothetical protein